MGRVLQEEFMKNKQLEFAKIKHEINAALNCAYREKNRKYIIKEVFPQHEEDVLSYYPTELWKCKVDKKSFQKSFDPKKCRSKIVNRIYTMKGRYVQIKLSEQEVSACKRYGLVIVSKLYKIYKPVAYNR